MTRARERLLLSGAVEFERWPEQRLGAPTISWLGPALGAELPALTATLEQPVCDLVVAGATGHASVRCRLNAPATVGTVLGRRAPRGDAREGGAGDDLPTSSQRAPSSIRVGTNAHAPREQQQQQSLPLDFGEDESPGAGSGARESHGAASGVGESRGARFGVGDSLSYTSLSELERCGYRYYLERVLRMRESRPQARARSSAAASRHGRAGRSCTGCSRRWTSRAPACRRPRRSRCWRASWACGWDRASARRSQSWWARCRARRPRDGAGGARRGRKERARRVPVRLLPRAGRAAASTA